MPRREGNRRKEAGLGFAEGAGEGLQEHTPARRTEEGQARPSALVPVNLLCSPASAEHTPQPPVVVASLPYESAP